MKRKSVRDKTPTEMADIVTRLRTWVHAVDAVPASDLMDEAADLIERLRPTDAERKALREAADAYGDNNDDEGSARIEDALRGLLERLR